MEWLRVDGRAALRTSPAIPELFRKGGRHRLHWFVHLTERGLSDLPLHASVKRFCNPANM